MDTPNVSPPTSPPLRPAERPASTLPPANPLLPPSAAAESAGAAALPASAMLLAELDGAAGAAQPPMSALPGQPAAAPATALPPLASVPGRAFSPPLKSAMAPALGRKGHADPSKKEEMARRLERMKAGLTGKSTEDLMSVASTPRGSPGGISDGLDPSSSSDRVQLLEREKDKLEKRIRSHVEHADKMKQTYQQLSDLYNKVRTDYAVLQRKDKKLQEMYNKMRDDFSVVSKKQRESESTLVEARAQAEIAGLEADSAVRAKMQELEEQRATAVAKLERESASMDKTKAELQTMLEAEREKQTSVASDLSTVRAKLAEMEKSSATLQKELFSLEEQNDKLRAEIANQADTSSRSISSAQIGAKEEIAKAVAEAEESRKMLESERKESQLASAKSAAALTAMVAERDALKRTLAGVERRVSDMSGSQSSAEAHLAAKQQDIDRLSKELADSRLNLKKAEQTREESFRAMTKQSSEQVASLQRELVTIRQEQAASKTDFETKYRGLEMKLKEADEASKTHANAAAEAKESLAREVSTNLEREKSVSQKEAAAKKKAEKNEEIHLELQTLRDENASLTNMVSRDNSRSGPIEDTVKLQSEISALKQEIAAMQSSSSKSSSDSSSEAMKKQRDALTLELEEIRRTSAARQRDYEHEIVRLKSELENTRDNSSVVEELIETKLKLAVLEDEKIALSQALRGEDGTNNSPIPGAVPGSGAASNASTSSTSKNPKRSGKDRKSFRNLVVY